MPGEHLQPPRGDGELLCVPPFAEWPALAAATASATSSWPQDLLQLRHLARDEALAEARAISSTLGISGLADADEGLVIATGHQPELCHPGAWVKQFLVDRCARENGWRGLDLVVDTDRAEEVAVRSPCRSAEGLGVCVSVLAEGATAAYVQRATPDGAAREAFRTQGLSALGTLDAPVLGERFASFCDALEAASANAGDLGWLLTAARRRYEAPAKTTYLELPVSAQARTAGFRTFVAMILHDAQRFALATNEALDAYRLANGTRSAAQPFPNLAVTEASAEAPFWLLQGGERRSVTVQSGAVAADGERLFELGRDVSGTASRLAERELVLVPRALTLTMFQRLFVADLFVHGTGGARYDEITDAVIGSFFGIAPPPFAVATLTMLLPLGAPKDAEEQIDAIAQRLHRLRHNPDQVLAEEGIGLGSEQARADALVAEKAGLIAAMAEPGADRKALGGRIRGVNEELGALLKPLADELEGQLARLRAQQDEAGVLADRTYPFCLFDPRDVRAIADRA